MDLEKKHAYEFTMLVLCVPLLSFQLLNQFFTKLAVNIRTLKTTLMSYFLILLLSVSKTCWMHIFLVLLLFFFSYFFNVKWTTQKNPILRLLTSVFMSFSWAACSCHSRYSGIIWSTRMQQSFISHVPSVCYTCSCHLFHMLCSSVPQFLAICVTCSVHLFMF